MVALSALLALPNLGLRLVQAGVGDPDLSWVSTTELLDLSEYLEGGEIIMTTGLSLGGDDPRWRDFVASLSRARVAAIGFGIGVNHERIPAPLIHAASTYRVALFEIPLPTPFIAVSKAVAELLRADELRAARVALQVQQRLLDRSRGDQDPAEVLASIAQATGRHLALLGSDNAVLASTAGFSAEQASSALPDGASAGTEYIALDAEQALRLAIVGSTPLTPEGRSVIAAGSMVLGAMLRGDRAEETRERGRWERFTEALLSGTGSPDSSAILDPSLELPGRIRAIALQGTSEDIAAWRRRPRSGLDRLIAASEEAPRAPGLSLAWQLCADLEAATAQALAVAASHGLDAVVGRPCTISDAPLSFRSAQARLLSLSPTAPLYTAPRVPQVVWADRDAPLLEALLSATSAGAQLGQTRGALSTSVLGPLSRSSTELPAAERAQLSETLRAVFRADGQRGPAAAALGIHRNTLRDRLTRIERITERSLADPDDRAELWFALRLEDDAG